MKEPEAKELLKKLISICAEHGLWVTIEEERKPDLKMIRVKEISIRVDK